MNQSLKAKVPSAILPFVQTPALLKGESPQEFFELLESVATDVGPNDIIEWLWTVRFINLVWDALRLRRLRAVYIDARHRTSLHSVIRAAKLPRTGLNRSEFDRVDKEASAAVEEWTANPSKFVEHDLSPDLVAATSTVQLADVLEKLDRRIDRAERLCDLTIQQLDTRRAVFACRAREAAQTLLHRNDASRAGGQPMLAGPDAGPSLSPISSEAGHE